MANIAILSDAHLLMQAQRYRDGEYISPLGEVSLKNFAKVIEQLSAKKPASILLAGDMFDEREIGGGFVADAEAAKYWPTPPDSSNLICSIIGVQSTFLPLP